MGHTGTLDRFATGLLVVLCGAFTKLASQVTGLEKTYVATLRFGAETDTLDPEGEVVAEAPVPSEETVRSRAASFVGSLRQTPPSFSAVHHEGERAYRKARRGELPELEARSVHVYALDVLAVGLPEAVVRVRCSKGTYVRALARDLGLACGSRAYLTALERVSVGPFHVEESVRPDEFDPERDVLFPRDALSRIPGLQVVSARPESERRIAGGGVLQPEDLRDDRGTAPTLAVLDREDRLLAVVDRGEQGFRYRFVVPGLVPNGGN